MTGARFWRGIPADRVVAVVATLDSGMIQFGSGYLLSHSTVITARHCTFDKKTGRDAVTLKIFRLSDGAAASVDVLASALDVAVLRVGGVVPWSAEAGLQAQPDFGRVDTTHSGELFDCEAMGFPLWQLEPQHRQRNAAELHGTIRKTEGAERGVLIMRDPLLWDVGTPAGAAQGDRAPGSPWGGLSGALIFHGGLALGVIIEHHPWQGHSALTVLPLQRVAELASEGAQDAERVAAALKLPAVDEWPFAGPLDADNDLRRVILGVATSDKPPLDWSADHAWRVVVTGLRAAGIAPDGCERQDEGDGCHLITLPTGIDPAITVPTLLRALSLVADQAVPTRDSGNTTAGEPEWVPLRVGLTYGSVQLASDRYVGPATFAARDMLTTRLPAPHPEQRAVAAVISDDLYLLLAGRMASGFDPDRFVPVSLPISGTLYQQKCWRYSPAEARDKGRPVVLSGNPATNTQSLSLDSVIPLAAMGTTLWFDPSHHAHQHYAAQASHHDLGGDEEHSEHHGADLDGHHDSWSQDGDLGDLGGHQLEWDDASHHDYDHRDFTDNNEFTESHDFADSSDFGDSGDAGYSGDFGG
jgi:hypothetical protein